MQVNWEEYRDVNLCGRYIPPAALEASLEDLSSAIRVCTTAESEMGRPIYKFEFGTGNIRVLIWSQMHGNESTTTKAVMDFCRFAAVDPDVSSNFRFAIIPMLNPDGAEAYTRVNANKIDLNRDFCDFSQSESRALRDLSQEFAPHFCFNMHDQRTIFGVGPTGMPATVSFLAPAFDESLQMNAVRKKAVHAIIAMNRTLQMEIPGQIGRFDDGFNPNCAGDHFQLSGIPTILVEAGHFPGDFDREQTRRLVFLALISAMEHISENDVVHDDIAEYLHIPQNSSCFYDIVYKNVRINYDSTEIITNFAVQFSEILEGGEIRCEGRIAKVDTLPDEFGHVVFDCEEKLFQGVKPPEIGDSADFTIGNTAYENGMPVI